MEGGGSRRNSLSNSDLDYPHPFRMNLKGWGKPLVTPSLTPTYATPTLRRAWRRGVPANSLSNSELCYPHPFGHRWPVPHPLPPVGQSGVGGEVGGPGRPVGRGKPEALGSQSVGEGA
jgi:hypothetical protein